MKKLQNKPTLFKEHVFKKLCCWAGLTILAATISACQTIGTAQLSAADCASPLPQRLELAITEAESRLAAGCEAQYAVLFDQLLAVGEGDPKVQNKRLFSEFLTGLGNKGIISPQQSKETYTRYFGSKFVSALGSFNNCASMCPVKDNLFSEMRSELQDKSRGLLNISSDQAGYGRANKLHAEYELSIEATCQACSS